MQAFCTQNVPVHYYNVPAIMNPIPHNKIVISYDHGHTHLEPTIISLDEAEAELNRNLFIRSGKSKSRNAKRKNDLSAVEKRELSRRELYLNALKAAKSTPGCGGVALRNEVIQQVHDEYGVDLICASTLGEWHRKEQEHEDAILATLPSKHRNRESQFSEEIQQLAYDIILKEYCKNVDSSITSAHKKLVKAIIKQYGENEEHPSYGTFRNWIKTIDPNIVTEKKYGKQAAREMKRKALQKLKTLRILERVEVDAVSLNVGIIDDNENYLGTVTLYVCIDCFSRAVLGYCVQIGRGENSASVIESFKHAIAPKEGKYVEACQNEWPMHGLIELLVADGGSGYASITTTSWCMRYNISRQTVETHSGWQKPFIESFFISLRAKFVSELPGYVGKKKWNRKLDYTIKEQAVMTLDDFKLQLTRFIVDEYHQVKHSGLNEQTPQESWLESARMFPPVLPDDLNELSICEGNTTERVIQGHKGVRINNIFYNDADGLLLSIYNTLKFTQTGKPTVRCEYSKNDISRITVLDPINDISFEVEACHDEVYSGMPLAEFQKKFPAKSQKKADIELTQFSDDNLELAQLHQKHAEKCKAKQSRSARRANINEITEQTIQDKLSVEQEETVKNTIKAAAPIIEEKDDDTAVDISELDGAYPNV